MWGCCRKEISHPAALNFAKQQALSKDTHVNTAWGSALGVRPKAKPCSGELGDTIKQRYSPWEGQHFPAGGASSQVPCSVLEPPSFPLKKVLGYQMFVIA